MQQVFLCICGATPWTSSEFHSACGGLCMEISMVVFSTLNTNNGKIWVYSQHHELNVGQAGLK